MKIIPARLHTYIMAWAALCVIIILMKDGSDSNTVYFSLLAGVTLLFAIVIFGMSKNRIILSPTGIAHQTLFKKKEILWQEVSLSEFKVMVIPATLVLTWYILSYDGKKIEIPLGQYARKGMGQIARAIVLNCPGALINTEVRGMAAGQFPWYVF